MNGNALLGILAIIYGGIVSFIAFKKPLVIWNMKKIEIFKKALGDKGIVVFFYFWSIGFIALGIWLLTK